MKALLLGIVGMMAVVFAATPLAAAASVNDFTITSYDIHYTLTRDTEQRSRLTTKETIVAEFPAADQNHGIERYIPSKYDGHSTSLRIESVKDQTGRAWHYTTYASGDYEVVRIGDADTYVHGAQTFQITYTQRDVTKYYSDTGRDEFYWDTNGTEWRVPIKVLNVTLEVDDSLKSALTGTSACYQGAYDSSEKCDVAQDGMTFASSAKDMSSGYNMTLALGFQPQTFAAYTPSFWEQFLAIWVIVQVALAPVVVGLVIWLAVRYDNWRRRKKELGTIVPEYLAPRDASVSLAATILPLAHASFAAQLVDFAVRHYVKLYETKPKSFWSAATYEIEIVKPIDDLRAEEQEFLSDVFKGNTVVGVKLSTDQLKKDYSLATRLSDNPKKLEKLMRSNYGLQQKDAAKSAWFKRTGTVLLVISLFFLSPGLLIAAIIAFILGATLWVLTEEGLALYRYLEGLKMYISVAESERLKMLQSPEGAEKVQMNGSDPKHLVKLYEKLLPYAIVFGNEKEWNRQLGQYYESAGTQPDWYAGAYAGTFSATAFSSAMSSLTTSINSTGAASSSSGGSGGGGSSGGGGGGGGGGGW